MQLSEITSEWNERLRVDDYEDAATNGLQVGPREHDVERVAFAVDAAAATIEDAVEWGADLLVTHHGVVWGGLDSVTGHEYDRVAPLIRNDCALYAAHLPLDGHPNLGNAALLADVLGVQETTPSSSASHQNAPRSEDVENRAAFGESGGETLGVKGAATTAYSADGLRERLESELDTGGRDVQVLDFGPEELREIAVLTGGGADWLREAEAAGVDAFVTGEGKQKLYHEAREAGVSVFLAGHYATETFGVQALREQAEAWDLETTFVDHPTGL